jgi:dTDP-4-amino-4,6-dideoxygalactose transaminase
MPVQVPFLDLKSVNQAYAGELAAAFESVMDSGWYVLGRAVERFEDEFAAYCGAGHAVGLANGLDALVLALRALDIGPGDEVIVPSHTFVATWLAVTQVGATPVPVEPLAQSFNLDPAGLGAALTPRTRAIIAVHLYGQSAELDPILAFAKAHGLKVVEDAAQAHGAAYQGRRIGAHGDVVAWSFYPGKNLGALGDGGAITTNQAELAEKIRVLRNYGSQRKYHHQVAGVNSRLDELQAAFLSAKLRGLDSANDRRRAIARTYQAALRGLPGLTVPELAPHLEAVWHLFVVRHPRRDALAQALLSRGVATMIHYRVAPHLQAAYSHLGIVKGSLPLAERLAAEVLSLPMSPTLTDEQVQHVIDSVRHIVLDELTRA